MAATIATRKPIDQITEQDWDELLEVNLKSVFLVTQRVLPAMRARRAEAAALRERDRALERTLRDALALAVSKKVADQALR